MLLTWINHLYNWYYWVIDTKSIEVKNIDIETMICIVSSNKPIEALNPSYWVGQAVKTIEIIDKRLTCLILLFIILFNKTVKSEQVEFRLQFRNVYHYDILSPYSLKSYNNR